MTWDAVTKQFLPDNTESAVLPSNTPHYLVKVTDLTKRTILKANNIMTLKKKQIDITEETNVISRPRYFRRLTFFSAITDTHTHTCLK